MSGPYNLLDSPVTKENTSQEQVTPQQIKPRGNQTNNFKIQKNKLLGSSVSRCVVRLSSLQDPCHTELDETCYGCAELDLVQLGRIYIVPGLLFVE